MICDFPGCDQPAIALLANDAPLSSDEYAERRVCRWHKSNPFPVAQPTLPQIGTGR